MAAKGGHFIALMSIQLGSIFFKAIIYLSSAVSVGFKHEQTLAIMTKPGLCFQPKVYTQEVMKCSVTTKEPLLTLKTQPRHTIRDYKSK